MMPGILAFISALPMLLSLISRLGTVLDSLATYAKENDLNRWIDDLEKSTDLLTRAKTSEEKLAAAQALVKTIRNMGKASDVTTS